MDYKVTIPLSIQTTETIVLPISMYQPLEQGEKLQSTLASLAYHGYKENTTILICDYLNRHNCANGQEAIAQGDTLLAEHKDMLEGFKLVRWATFLNQRQEKFAQALQLIQERSPKGSRFYDKMRKTWEKCLSANHSLDASIAYQQEEYAAILCMDEFDHLIYPKRITNGMAYLYNNFDGHKPVYHQFKIAEIKAPKNPVALVEQKQKRHVHIAFRALLDHAEELLKSNELSDKAKAVFAEEMENLLMSNGLLTEDISSDEQVSSDSNDKVKVMN